MEWRVDVDSLRKSGSLYFSWHRTRSNTSAVSTRTSGYRLIGSSQTKRKRCCASIMIGTQMFYSILACQSSACANRGILWGFQYYGPIYDSKKSMTEE